MPALFYGFETWSLTFKEEHSLAVFEKRPNWGKGSREWKELSNELFHDFYSSLNITRENEIKYNEMGRTCSTYWENRGSHRILVRDPEGEKLFCKT